MLSACDLCHTLAADTAVAQSEFMNIGGGKSILLVLIRYIEDLEISESACWAIGNLAASNSESCRRFGLIGAGKALAETLERYQNNCLLCEACTHALSIILTEEENVKRFGELGVNKLVIDVLKRHNTSAAVMEFISSILISLMDQNLISTELIYESNLADVILIGLQTHALQTSIAEKLCVLISKIAFVDGTAEQLLGKGLSEALVSALDCNLSCVGITEQCCIMLSDLCCYEDGIARLALNESACSIVIKALVQHGTKNNLVAKSGCDVLLHMTRLDTVELLKSEGICELLVELLKQHGNDQAVVCSVCKYILKICMVDNLCVERLCRSQVSTHIMMFIPMQMKAVEPLSAMLDALVTLVTNASVMDDTVRSGGLMRDGATGDDGLGVLLADLVSMHSAHEHIVLKVCNLILPIFTFEPIQAVMLRNSDLGERLLESLLVHIASSKVAEIGCILIRHFSTKMDTVSNVKNSPEVIKKLANFCFECLRYHQKQLNIVISMLESASLLLAGSTELWEAFSEAKIYVEVIECLKLYVSSTSLSTISCHIFKGFMSVPTVAVAMREAGLCEVLSDVLLQHVGDSTIVAVGSDTLREQVQIDPSSAAVFHRAGTYSSIALAVERHRWVEPVIASICATIPTVVAADPYSSTAFQGKDITRALLLTIKTFEDNPKVFTAICRTLSVVWSSESLSAISEIEMALCALSSYMLRYLTDLEPLEQMCALMGNIVSTNRSTDRDAKIKEALVTNGICSRVLEVLRQHQKNVFVSTFVCNLIYHLTIGSCTNSAAFGRSGCELLIQIIRNNSLEEGLITSACAAVAALSSDSEDYMSFFGDLATCELLLGLMQSHGTNGKVIGAICNTLSVLCNDLGCFERVLASNPSAVLRATLETHSNGDVQVLQSLVSLLAVVATSNFNTTRSEISFWSKDSQGGQTLVDLLRIHRECSALVSGVCRVIHCISDNNIEAVKQFGAAGACDILSDLVERYEQDAGVVEQICFAIGYLCIQCVDNVRAFHAKDVAESIVEVLRSHLSSKGVCLAAGFAIRYLAGESAANELFGELRTCEFLIETIKSHTGRHTEVVAMCCWALRKLLYSSGSPGLVDTCTGNLTRVMKVQGCAVVTNSLKRHSVFPDVAVAALWVIRILATIETGRTELGDLGACEVVVQALRTHSEVHWVAIQGLWAMYNLGKGVHDDNLIRLAICGGCEVVVKVMKLHVALVDVVERGCLLLRLLVKHNSLNSVTFDDAGAIGVISDCLVRYADSTISEQAVSAMRELLLSDDSFEERQKEIVRVE